MKCKRRGSTALDQILDDVVIASAPPQGPIHERLLHVHGDGWLTPKKSGQSNILSIPSNSNEADN